MPTTRTTSPTTARVHWCLPRWSALWAPHQPTPRSECHQTGGIARHEAPTRRRHTPGRLRVVQNPHRCRYGGRRRDHGLAAAPGKPAGPQATTSTTQQHAVPYNPDPANQVEDETPKHGPDDRQERENGDGRDDDSCLTQLECPLRPVIPGEETSEAPRRRHHAEQEEQGEYVPGQRLDDLRDRGGWRHFDGRRCRRWVHSCRSCVPHAPTSTLSGSATGPRLTTGHTRAQTRINAGAAQTHSLRGPRSFRDDVAQSLTA